jgi:hypothetical protein
MCDTGNTCDFSVPVDKGNEMHIKEQTVGDHSEIDSRSREGPEDISFQIRRASIDVEDRLSNELTWFEAEIIESVALRQRNHTRAIEGKARDRSRGNDALQTLFRGVGR